MRLVSHVVSTGAMSDLEVYAKMAVVLEHLPR